MGVDAKTRSEDDAGDVATVAIVGGGFTGATIAWHLARLQKGGNLRIRLLIFEPRGELGRGLAYDDVDPVFRINVPAVRMTIDTGQPLDFSDWLENRGEKARDPEGLAEDGQFYARRAVFGAYVAERLAPLVADGVVEHIQTQAEFVRRGRFGWEITTALGVKYLADALVLAATHPPVTLPQGIPADLRSHPRLIHDLTRPGALSDIATNDRILIIGCGLTSADVIASLEARGHKGSILVFSRRGLRSRSHPPRTQDPVGDFTTSPSRTALDLLRRIRRDVRLVESAGGTWHPVLDAVRQQGQAIWQALPVSEQRKIVHRLRPFWDVHRFRIAPQINDAIERGLSSGRIEIVAAQLARLAKDGDRLVATLVPRRGSEPRIQAFEAVIVTTGPSHSDIFRHQPFLAHLRRDGWIRPDEVGLGLKTARDGHAIGADDRADPALFIAGPLARGTLGELMGLPQVTDYAIQIAGEVYAYAERYHGDGENISANRI